MGRPKELETRAAVSNPVLQMLGVRARSGRSRVTCVRGALVLDRGQKFVAAKHVSLQCATIPAS